MVECWTGAFFSSDEWNDVHLWLLGGWKCNTHHTSFFSFEVKWTIVALGVSSKMGFGLCGSGSGLCKKLQILLVFFRSLFSAPKSFFRMPR
jgi:hypothetical protein